MALQAADGLVARMNGELTLIGVADPSYGYAGEWSALTVGEFHVLELEVREESLRAAEARLSRGIEVNTQLLTGPVGPTLADASRDFDLMFSGSRGYGPVLRTLLGSATRSLMAEDAARGDPAARGQGDAVRRGQRATRAGDRGLSSRAGERARAAASAFARRSFSRYQRPP